MGQTLKIFLLLGMFVMSALCEDTGCDVGYTCLPRKSCASYLSKLEELRKVGKEKGKSSSEYMSILGRLRSFICNKADKKVCCDISNDEEFSPNFIPNIERGECGITGDAAFIFGECRINAMLLSLCIINLPDTFNI